MIATGINLLTVSASLNYLGYILIFSLYNHFFKLDFPFPDGTLGGGI